jgi:hypothetical protein
MNLQWVGQAAIPTIEESKRKKRLWTVATVTIIGTALVLAYRRDKRRGIY